MILPDTARLLFQHMVRCAVCRQPPGSVGTTHSHSSTKDNTSVLLMTCKGHGTTTKKAINLIHASQA